jgi:molybdopterin synthase catalytic subunit
MYRLVREPIPTPAIISQLVQPADGAVVSFEGLVRNHAQGKEVRYLEYQAYESMALIRMEAIGNKALETWPVRSVAIIHRLGRLEIGECSVLIVVTAAHRKPAFEACQYAIDTLKLEVPIWKKEFYLDGAVWIEGAA